MTPFWQNKTGKMKDASKWARPGAYFDPDKAQFALDFIQTCKHVKGELAGQPIELDPWQREIVRGTFGWLRNVDDMRLFREVYVEVPRKNGKLLDDSTPVPTPDGWRAHGDLKPGDFVFAPNGSPTPVLAATGSYEGPGYNVKFSDGTSIVAHERHDWNTERTWFTKRRRGERRPLPTVETGEIRKTLKVSGKRRDFVHRIDLTEALELPTRKLPIEPYVLGVWLGDGHSAGARLTCFDSEILDNLRERGIRISDQNKSGTYQMGFDGVRVRNDRGQ